MPLWAATRGRYRRHPPTCLRPHSTISGIFQVSPSAPCHKSRLEHMLASRENGFLAKDVVCGEAITTCPSMAQDGGHPPHFDGCGPQKVVKGRHGDAMGMRFSTHFQIMPALAAVARGVPVGPPSAAGGI